MPIPQPGQIGVFGGVRGKSISANGGSPTVETTTTSSEDEPTSSHTVSLPAGIEAGDLLIVIFRTGSSGTTHNTPSGWDLVVSASSVMSVFSRIADGSEGSELAVSTQFGRPSAHIAYRISGGDTVEGNTSDSNDPPSLTPSWGSAVTLWLAVFTGREPNDVTAAPENYQDLISRIVNRVGFSDDCRAASAWRQLEVETEDPSAFETGSVNTPRSATLAIVSS